MQSFMKQPSCSISYFLLALNSSLFFFQCTDTPGLDSSQDSKAELPSSALTFCSSSVKYGGSSIDIKKKGCWLYQSENFFHLICMILVVSKASFEIIQLAKDTHL